MQSSTTLTEEDHKRNRLTVNIAAIACAVGFISTLLAGIVESVVYLFIPLFLVSTAANLTIFITFTHMSIEIIPKEYKRLKAITSVCAISGIAACLALFTGSYIVSCIIALLNLFILTRIHDVQQLTEED